MSIRTRTRVGLSAVAALTLATGAALATAAPAAAAETVGNVTWYGSADFGQESGGYPANAWFFGDPKDGDAGFTANGLEIATDAGERVQVLTNLAANAPISAGDFVSYVEEMRVVSHDSTWTFQLPVFGNGAGEFTTLRTAAGEQPSASGTWTTSRPIYDSDGTTELYGANASATLTDFATALFAGAPPTILAAGFRVGEGDSATVVGFWDGEILSAFTPAVTRTITPNPVTPAEAATSGIRLQGTGWLPGSTVYVLIYTCEGPTTLYHDESAVAGPDGIVDVTAVLAEQPAEGTYCVDFDDDGLFYHGSPWRYLGESPGEVIPSYPGGMPPLELTVKNVLPATGLEVTGPIAGGIAFLVLGGIALAATRRMDRAKV